MSVFGRTRSPSFGVKKAASQGMRSEIPDTIRIEFVQRLVLAGSDTVHKGERLVIEDDPAVIVTNQDHQVSFVRTARAAKQYQTPVARSYPEFAERQVFHNGVALAISRLAECGQWWKPGHNRARRLDS